MSTKSPSGVSQRSRTRAGAFPDRSSAAKVVCAFPEMMPGAGRNGSLGRKARPWWAEAPLTTVALFERRLIVSCKTVC